MKNYAASDFIGADITITALTRACRQINRMWAMPRKFTRQVEGLLYFIRGGIEYYFDDRTFQALPGQVVCLPSGQPYNGIKLDADVNEYYLIDFSCLPGQFAAFPIPDSFYPANPDSVVKAFRGVIELWERRSVCSALEAKNAASELLCMLAKDAAVNLCGYDDRSQILRMTDYMRERCADPDFRAADAAAHFHISETHLRRIFSAELKMPPAAYLSELRIERARVLLTGRMEMSIRQVAEECGFASAYYFSSAFSRAVGCSPSRYRAMMFGGRE